MSQMSQMLQRTAGQDLLHPFDAHENPERAQRAVPFLEMSSAGGTSRNGVLGFDLPVSPTLRILQRTVRGTVCCALSDPTPICPGKAGNACSDVLAQGSAN